MMNMIRCDELIRELNADVLVIHAEGKEKILSQELMIGLGIAAAIGILLALFGLKIVRLWAALAGFVIGSTLGCCAAEALGGSDMVILAAEIAVGIIFAALGGIIYRLAVFLTVFGSVSLAAVYLSTPQSLTVLLICIGAGLIAGLIAVRFKEFLTIVATAVCGASIGGSAVYYLIPADQFYIQVLICVGIGAVGIWIQLLFESRRKKRLNLKKAAQIREEKSTENEVERARALIDDLDEDASDENADIESNLPFETVSLDDIEDDIEEDFDEDTDDDPDEDEYLDDPDEDEYLDETDDVRNGQYDEDGK